MDNGRRLTLSILLSIVLTTILVNAVENTTVLSVGTAVIIFFSLGIQQEKMEGKQQEIRTKTRHTLSGDWCVSSFITIFMKLMAVGIRTYKKTHKRRFFNVEKMIALAVVLLLFVGCSSDPSAGEDTEEKPTTKEKVTEMLERMFSGPDEALTKLLIRVITKAS